MEAQSPEEGKALPFVPTTELLLAGGSLGNLDDSSSFPRRWNVISRNVGRKLGERRAFKQHGGRCKKIQKEAAIEGTL
jgi:hypothetical protein